MKKIIEGKFNLLISIVLYCLSVAIFLISQLSIVSGTFMSGSVFSYNYPLRVAMNCLAIVCAAIAAFGKTKKWILAIKILLSVFIIAFILIFAIVICVLMLVGKLLEATVKIILLGWLNKVLGLIFALFKYILIIGLVIVFFDMLNSNLNIVSEKFLDNSILYTGIKRTAYSIFPYFKELLF